MTTLPIPVLAGVAAVALGLPLLAWAAFSRPPAVVAEARGNLQRGLALGSADPGARPSKWRE